STWQAIRATRSEHEQVRLRVDADRARKQAEADEQTAKTEAAKSAQVATFLQDMLGAVGPSVALGRDTELLREILEKTAKRLDDLKDQPAVQAELRSTLGGVYFALGEYAKAEAMTREALSLRRRLFGDDNLAVAMSMYDLGRVLAAQAKLTEAETEHREALALR